MKDAITERKSKFWNWGGTWENQKNVYRFKSRWATQDYPYYYHIFFNYKKFKQSITEQKLLKQYQYFYTIPFSELKKL